MMLKTQLTLYFELRQEAECSRRRPSAHTAGREDGADLRRRLPAREIFWPGRETTNMRFLEEAVFA